AATARYVAGGPTMSWVGWGVSVIKDQGPRCPGSGPMMVCTAPPSSGLAIMLLWRDSPTTGPCVMASLISFSPISLSYHPDVLGVSSLLISTRGRGASVQYALYMSAYSVSPGRPTVPP